MSTKEQILEYLKKHEGYVSGEELSEHLNISRTAVWKNINNLRNSDYKIDSITNRGYKLVYCPDKITSEIISSGLDTKFLAKKVYCYDSIDSTNEEAKRQALHGAPDGSLFIAEKQLGGKGRLGRTWESPSGCGLWFSVLLRKNMLPPQVTSITLLAGLAVCRTICKMMNCDAMIKWPNDIVIGSKKVCGILTEMVAEIGRIEYVVVGIGINVNNESFSEEISVKATSLLIECGHSFVRTDILKEILKEFELVLNQYSENPKLLLEEYKNSCVSLNKTVGFTHMDKKMTGKAVDISSNGELVVKCDDGKLIPIHSGEVTVQGIYGQ
jgi:BirA family biotin operon repressor/biotin-[acetyl-CoA-carboxylase] ligase